LKAGFEPVRRLPLLLAAVAVAIGVWARLKGFGRWPVSYDEFFIGQSVRNILDHGVPRIGENGLYVRGLLVQYVAAGARLAGFGEESAIRLLPLLCNLSAIPALWLLARRLGGRSAASVAVALFALSAWEIEFSRFGRMYAPIQAVTLGFALLFRDVVADGREDRRKWLAALAALAIPIHESSVFLALALFLPDLAAWRRPRAIHLAAATALLAAAVYWNANDFRNFAPARQATGAARLAQVAGGAGGKLFLPSPMFPMMKDRPWGLLPVGIASLAAGLLVRQAARRREDGPSGAGRAALAAGWLLGFAHAFAALPLVWGAAAMNGFFGPPGRARRRLALSALGIAALFFAGWGIYAAGLVSDPGARLSAPPLTVVARLLFAWPDIAGRIVPIWWTVLPRFLAATILVTAAAVPLWRREPPERIRGLQATGTLFLFLLALSAIVKTPYVSTRYAFPLMPFLFLSVGCGIAAIARALSADRSRQALAVAAAAAAFLALSEDTRANRLFRPDAARTNFRMDDTLAEAHHYVPRFDFRSPAAFVDANRRLGDRVVLTLLQPAFYLAQPADGFYIRKGSPEFFNHHDDRTGRERWTGIPVLPDPESMKGALLAPGTTWLIAGGAGFPFDRDLHRSLAQAFGAGLAFRGVDGQVVVYKVVGGPPAAAGRGGGR
jgi:drug/metabolite transporter superfamily protein YnfA